MAHSYRFSTGPWNISEGRDPYGPETRPAQSLGWKLARLREGGFDAVMFHDDDIVPEIDTKSSAQILKEAAEVGVHKLLFGTDATLHSHDWELARLLSLPLETDDFRRILHDNFMGIIAPLLENRDLSLICQDQPQLGRRQRPQRHRP